MKRTTYINLLFFLGTAALILAAVVLRVALEAREVESKAAVNLAFGRVEQAIIYYDRAMHWYLPGAPHIRRSIEALTSIAEKAEQTGDVELALEAWRTLRSGLLASRSLYTPYPDVIRKCESRIADLVSHKFGKGPGDAGYDNAMIWQQASFRRYPGPNPFWATVAVLGFMGWVGSGFGLAYRAFPGDRGLKIKPAVLFGSLIVIFYALWIIGMMRA